MNKRKHTDFAAYLQANHYSASTVTDYVSALGRLRLDYSIQDALLIYENINSCLEKYASTAPARSYACAKVAANRFFQMMVGQTLAEFSASRKSETPSDHVLAEFFHYSVNFKQMTAAAARSECLHVRTFIEQLGCTEIEQFSAISAADIRDHVMTHFDGLKPSSMGRYVTSLRNFFRFLEYKGVKISASILTLPSAPANWKGSKLPVSLTARISEQLDEYLDYKHSLGFRLKHEETVLRSFAKYTLDTGHTGSLNIEIVLAWIASGSHKDKTMARKIQAIKPFSRYVSAFDSEAQSIEGKFYRNTHDRPEPYIYSENEVLMLMEECNHLYSPDGLRARTIKCIIGLLWATGMRPSEPVNLKRKDVDLENACITIRESKFAKERIIPVSDSVIRELDGYISWLTPLVGDISPDEPLFRTTGGVPLCERSLSYAFSLIRDSIGAVPAGYPHVRLYDFRHTLACRTILRWLNEGKDSSALIYNLSAFLGHAKVEDTYWYLTATPELMNITCSMYEKRFGGEYDA